MPPPLLLGPRSPRNLSSSDWKPLSQSVCWFRTVRATSPAVVCVREEGRGRGGLLAWIVGQPGVRRHRLQEGMRAGPAAAAEGRGGA